MDKINQKIVAVLQENGRISLTELSERVGISLSPCQRRVKSMEEEGIITGYRAEVDSKKVGLEFSSLIFVTVNSSAVDVLDAFEDALKSIPEVIQAQRLFGNPDYLLHVMTHNLESYQKLYDEKLTSIPGVQKLMSTLVMKDVVINRALPIDI